MKTTAGTQFTNWRGEVVMGVDPLRNAQKLQSLLPMERSRNAFSWFPA